MALGDLALFMLTVSDNAATDVLYHRVGQPAIDAVVTNLGLRATKVCTDIGTIVAAVVTELRLDDPAELDAKIADAGPAAVWGPVLHRPRPDQRGNAPRDRHSGGSDLDRPSRTRGGLRDGPGRMSQTMTAHGLSAAFPDRVSIASKTGTLPVVRNEAGVLTYPDGRRYVGAAFTRAVTLTNRQPAIDDAIGHAARAAVDKLRPTQSD
ncbi:serine hydrolase [Cryptosporangium sp. NPDC048952]|uniref:serine hydrolase n=1 Tax=Cryptosporangium sp. NPDC048952 TaxID=3363961 RepID=UPI0037140596